MPRIRYRVWQFWQTLSAHLTTAESNEVAEVLPPQLFSLFLSMNAGEQTHALRVYRAVKMSGIDSAPLLTAALLHDVGKTRVPLSPWQRAIVVAAKVLTPQKISDWGQGEPIGWRKPFVVAAHHAEWGAQMAIEGGAEELTARLIREHQTASPNGLTSEEAELLSILQQADDRN